jgi:phage terminase large subunit GpA-like protein
VQLILEIRTENIKKAITNGLLRFITKEPLSGSEWAEQFFYLSKESSSTPGKWFSRPYQVALLDWAGSDDIEVMTWKKSARTGYTKIILSDACYKIEHKNRKVAVFQPTDTDAKEFSKDEIATAIRDIPVMRAIFKDGNPDKRGPHNKTDRKEFTNGSILYIRGATSPTNFRRITTDQSDYDECAEMDSDVGSKAKGAGKGQGSPFTLGDKRFHTSSFGKSIRGSTPTHDESLLEESISDADMIFERNLLCPHCDHYFIPDKSIFNLEDPTEIYGTFPCTKCGTDLKYGDYAYMDEHGRWMTENGEWYDEETRLFHSHTGEPIPPPRHIGVKLWEAYSYDKGWDHLFSKWNSAVRKYRQGQVGELKGFVNTSLGEAFAEIKEKVSADILTDRLEAYGERIPNEIYYITMAVDVQGGKDSRLECEIIGWGEGFQNWSLDYIVIKGDTLTSAPWDHLDKERERKFIREDGFEMPISHVGIDSSYRTDTVYSYVIPRQRFKVFALKGDDGARPIVSKYTLQGERKNVKLHIVGVDQAKDNFFTQVKITEPGPGCCHFPNHYPESYFKGLFSERKEPLGKKNKPFTFVKLTSKIKNEPLDLRVYNMALILIANPNLEMIKRRIQTIVEARKHGVDPVAVGGRRVRHEGEKY